MSDERREPLVLLSGMNCSSDLWRGCGLDDAVSVDLAEPNLSAQLDRLLDTLPSRFALAGLSLGGIVAMALCRVAPERVSRLCLLSTNAKAPTEAQREAWRNWRQQLAQGESPRALQRGILAGLLSRPGDDPSLDERVLQMADETGPQQLNAQLGLQLSRVDESSGLASLRVPTLVVSGSLDRICPPANHHLISKLLPCGQLASVDAGHLTPMEQPEKVGQLIKNWVG